MEYFLLIAEVQFHIHTNQLLLPVRDIQQGALRQFFFDTCRNDLNDHVDIRITDNRLPDMGEIKKIFDSDGSWSVYSGGNERYVVDGFPPYTDPVWMAKLNPTMTNIKIFCNPEIIDPTRHLLTYNLFSYPLDQILLMNYLSGRHGCILHSAGCVINGKGLILAGKSGTGKSTVSHLINKTDTGLILSDDRIAVRKIDDQFIMYGTPWPGESGFAVNQSAPVKGFVFLNHGNENRIVDLKSFDAMDYLFPVMSIPWYDKGKVLKMLEFCESLLAHIPMYQLTFRADESVADFIKAFMDG